MHYSENVYRRSETKKPLARWTIGNTNKQGWECLWESIRTFTSFYDVDVVIAYNCDTINCPTISPCFHLFNQRVWASDQKIAPMGVAWKLYPTRFNPDGHEIQIDNDIVFTERIQEIDEFFSSNCTLLLEENSRTYGRFERHVPKDHRINSGIFGIPPNFNLQKYVDFYGGDAWEKNAFGEHDKNETFDEQGLVAFALLSYPKYVIIPQSAITNSEHELKHGKGHHFIGLNRRDYHWPYRAYQWSKLKTYL